MNYDEFRKHYYKLKNVNKILEILDGVDNEVEFIKTLNEAVVLRIDELESKLQFAGYDKEIIEKRIEGLKSITTLCQRRLNLEVFS